MFTFIFLGKDSYKDYGILVSKKPVNPFPQERVEEIIVPGRHGVLTYTDGDREPFNLSIECTVIDSQVRQQGGKIKAWLMGGTGQLILSDEPDKYYTARVINSFDIDESIKTWGTFVIVFRCQPLKYNLDPDITILIDQCITRNSTEPNPLNCYNPVSITTFTANLPIRISTPGSFTISNLGTAIGTPVITIYGSGNVIVTINGIPITINNISSYATIDAVLQDCYKDTTLKNNDMIGEFPILNVGDNTISWSGTVNRIEVNFSPCFI